MTTVRRICLVFFFFFPCGIHTVNYSGEEKKKKKRLDEFPWAIRRAVFFQKAGLGRRGEG